MLTRRLIITCTFKVSQYKFITCLDAFQMDSNTVQTMPIKVITSTALHTMLVLEYSRSRKTSLWRKRPTMI